MGTKTMGNMMDMCTESINKQTTDMKMKVIKNENTEATNTYTCSMHPEVISNKHGKCPKCGMELIEIK